MFGDNESHIITAYPVPSGVDGEPNGYLPESESRSAHYWLLVAWVALVIFAAWQISKASVPVDSTTVEREAR
jgi:hypothetical protein